MENRYKISRSAGQTQTAEQENNPDEKERERERVAQHEGASETQMQTRATRAAMSRNNNNFEALPKSNMAELNVCALLFVRSFAICGHCCHDNRLHALAPGRGAAEGKGTGM